MNFIDVSLKVKTMRQSHMSSTHQLLHKKVKKIGIKKTVLKAENETSPQISRHGHDSPGSGLSLDAGSGSGSKAEPGQNGDKGLYTSNRPRSLTQSKNSGNLGSESDRSVFRCWLLQICRRGEHAANYL